MKNITVFENSEFGSIRTVEIDGQPYFVGKDVAKVLGYTNQSKALSDHVDKEDMSYNESLKLSRQSGAWLINESGLYSLILSSKKPNAKKFKKWVTAEVLPSIRKHGAYMTPETIREVLLNPDTMIQILQNLKSEQEKNKELKMANEALARKENEWDNASILNALIRAYSANACNNNFQIGWNTFYKRLRYSHGIDVKIRCGRDNRRRALINYIYPDEMKIALSLAASMCEEKNLNIGQIINETNEAIIMA